LQPHCFIPVTANARSLVSFFTFPNGYVVVFRNNISFGSYERPEIITKCFLPDPRRLSKKYRGSAQMASCHSHWINIIRVKNGNAFVSFEP
jgi:hypothetical protein